MLRRSVARPHRRPWLAHPTASAPPETQATAPPEPPPRTEPVSSSPPSPWRRASFAPVPLFAAIVIVSRVAFPPAQSWDPGWAILVGNTVFVTGVSLVVSYLAFRTFSASGRLQVLVLASGVLVFGIAAAVAAAARRLPDGANLNVTIYNVGALLGAASHALASFLLVAGSSREVSPPRRSAWLGAALAWPVAAVALLALACAWGLVPPFFVQGAGPTQLRQIVLGGAAFLFLFSFAVAGGTYLRTRETFLYWYACALGLSAISVVAFLVQRAVGSPVGWAGRLSQYAGGVYFLVALATAARTALLRGTSLESVLTSSLSGAEEKFRALAENAPDVIRRFDRDLSHIYVNMAGQRLYGKAASSLVGRGVGATGLGAPQAAAWEERLRRVFRTGTPEEVEEYLETRDGLRYHQSICVPEYGPDGAVANVLVLSRDLTDRRRAEERTRRQNAVLEGIARIFRETLGAETEEQLGRTCLAVAQELTGAAFGFLAELSPETGRLDDVAISDPGWVACRISDASGHVRRLSAGLPVRGLHGRVLEEGRSLVCNDPASHPDSAGTPPGHPALEAFLGVPMQREGRTVGVIGLGNRPGGFREEDREAAEFLAPAIVQALERKRAQQALRASEERLRLAASLAEALSFIGQLIHSTLDLDEIIRRALTESVAALGAATAAVSMREGGRWVVRHVHGLAPEIIGTVMRDEDEPHAVLAIERREPVAVSDALRDLRVNRERLAAWGIRSVLVVPLVVRGDPLGVCFFNWTSPAELGPAHVDFAVKLGSMMSLAAENARLVGDLREAAHRKDEFLGMLSHELRNPLAPIRNSVFVLERAPGGSEPARRAREVIRRQIEHLTRLVDDLLDVTRISRGKIELHRVRVDLRDLVRRACDDHRGLFQQHRIALELAVGDAVWVDADETRILQVMGNLLQNAARFGRADGTVAVEVGARDGRACIRVRDDGIGIAPAFLPHVFEPFVQEDNDLARSKGGLGLGLALVKGLVELHGGSVSVGSDGPGRGAEFAVTLRLAPAPAQAGPAELAPARDAVAGAATRQRILVVDDNPDEATTLRDALALGGHDVVVAHDGAEAVEKARALRPTAVLCDIGLPKMNGFEVARSLRADPALAGIRLVALTGYARPEDVRAAEEAGFDHHIAKPATIPDIERALGSAGAPRCPAPPSPGPARAPAAERPAALPGPLPAPSPALSDFLSRVFHDLRAPFRDVEKGCSELLAAEAADAAVLGDLGRQQVAAIHRALARAQALVDDLQVLWRITSADLGRVDVDLTAAAREIVARLARAAPERRVAVAIEDGLRARGDARTLRVVLEHLLGNAWKFSAPRAEAHVAFGRADTPLGPAFFVRDDGVGFDPAYTATLFEPFQRLHPQSEFEGTGLGLHIVRRAVERHGGRAWIESVPGATTVHFTLREALD